MGAVFILQLGQRIFKSQLHRFHYILRNIGGQGADHAFKGRGQHLILHAQHIIGFFEIVEALFEAAQDVSFNNLLE